MLDFDGSTLDAFADELQKKHPGLKVGHSAVSFRSTGSASSFEPSS